MTYIVEETYTKDGEERTSNKLVLKARAGEDQLADGETVRVTVSGDPSYWNDYPNKYSTSTLCFFKMDDDATVQSFIPSNLRAQKPGVNLIDVVKKLSDGDTIDITRTTGVVKKGQFAGQPFDIFRVEAVSVEGGILPVIGADSGN